VSLLELEFEPELGASVMTLPSSPEHAKSVNIAMAKYARIQRFFMKAP
jgi:hypothetical protein